MPNAPTQPKNPPHKFQPTNNVTRSTFEFIKENPGLPRKAVTKAMQDKGYKPTSVASLLTQMLRQKMISVVNKGLFPNQDEFTPIRPSLVRNNRLRKPKVQQATPAPMPKPIPMPKPMLKPTPSPTMSLEEQKRVLIAERQIKIGWTVQAALEGLSVLQARQLYDELRKIFKD